MARFDRSLVISNPMQVAGAPQMHLPRGIDADAMYGDYDKGYEQRRKEQARWAQKQNQLDRGYVRMKDPQTGTIYDMRPDQYDPTVGGYRNPHRPTELLQPVKPGE